MVGATNKVTSGGRERERERERERKIMRERERERERESEGKRERRKESFARENSHPPSGEKKRGMT